MPSWWGHPLAAVDVDPFAMADAPLVTLEPDDTPLRSRALTRGRRG